MMFTGKQLAALIETIVKNMEYGIINKVAFRFQFLLFTGSS